MAMLCLLTPLRGAVVEDFEAAPVMNCFQATQRGYSCVTEAPPAGGAGKKAAKIAWQEAHQHFFEIYYAHEVALPDTKASPAGQVRVKLYCQMPRTVKLLAVRVKDAKNEIFHFDVPVNLQAKAWQEIVVDVKTGAQKGSWGGPKTGTMTGPLFVTGYGFVIDAKAPAGELWFDDVAWDGAKAGAAATQPAAPPPAPKPLAELMGKYRIEEAHLAEPFWRSPTVYGESVLFVQEKEAPTADGRLLFAPQKILRVRSGRGDMEYEQGRDYTVAADGRLLLTPQSRIAFLKRDELYRRNDEKQAIKHKVGDPQTWLLWMEGGYQPRQVEVDYERAPADAAQEAVAFKPKFAGDSLPRFLGKLKARQAVRIALTGDSISAGANASRQQAPFQPSYSILLARQLEIACGARVELINVSVGGATSDGGLKGIAKVVEAKPDLVIIAYGMNDVAGRNAKRYGENVSKMMQAVRGGVPEAEFVLVATSLANPEWNYTPAAEFAKYRQALSGLCGPGVALADVTGLWEEMLRRKRYHDLTGNGVNHPNDFGHRLYAQVLLGMLVEE